MDSSSKKKKLVLDRAKTKVRLRTFAEGLFARLAHDLELECRELTGDAEIDPSTNAGTARIVAPIEKIDVLGTLSKDKKVDPKGLSPSDREDCLGKMRKDVFHTTSGNVTVEATIDDGGKAKVTITPPNGKTITMPRPLNVDSGAKSVSGTLEVSLSAIGSDTVKGPMNAFRVKDVVEILFDVTFMPADP